jgi:hypothetical protein
MKMTALWDIAPRDLGGDRRFRVAYCLRHQGDVMEKYAPLKRQSSFVIYGALFQKVFIYNVYYFEFHPIYWLNWLACAEYYV